MEIVPVGKEYNTHSAKFREYQAYIQSLSIQVKLMHPITKLEIFQRLGVKSNFIATVIKTTVLGTKHSLKNVCLKILN